MKKKILLLSFIILGLIGLQAQNPFFVGGYVTNLNGGAIANHQVFIISDSSSVIPFTATTTTNANGYYSFNNVVVTAPGLTVTYVVYTFDCNGVMHSQTVTNANPQNVLNFSICASNTTNSCNASFVAYPDSNALSNIVHFSNISTTTYLNTPIQYLWNFGDGTTSTLANPTHTYSPASATYNVCLTMTVVGSGAILCVDDYCQTLTVGQVSNACQNNFTFTHQLNNYSFTGYVASNYPTTYQWSFGDGTMGQGQYVNHVYTASNPSGPSTYTVCLFTTSIDPLTGSICTDSSFQTIVITNNQSNCNAGFIAYPDSLMGINSMHFTNTSTTNLSLSPMYFWNFGDGTTSNQINPVHTFAPNAQGYYNVCLTMKILNSAGVVECIDDFCQNVYVGTTQQNCQNYFTQAHQGNIYTFTGHVNNTNPTVYKWSFGDGTYGMGQNATHAYQPSSSGTATYTVCLITITTSSNTMGGSCTDTSCQTITISNTSTNCTAGFVAYPDSIQSNKYYFNNTSLTNLSYPILYLWNFGDGTTSTLANPTHIFQPNPVNGGVYNVCLTMKILNSAGVIECVDDYCQTIYVNGNQQNCNNDITHVNQGLNYVFTGHVNNTNPTTYSWNFGDGTTATGQNVTHTFAQPSTGVLGYTVCLVTVTSNGNGTACTDTTCQFVSINNTSGSIIQGHVYAGNYPVSNGYVILYQANNATMSYNVVDTLVLDTNGYFMYQYLNMPPQTPAFLIKAVLMPGTPNYNQFVPTFYNHAFNWFAATPVFPSASSVYYNINMIQIPVTASGTFTLSGNVMVLGTKSSGNSPISGVELILTEENDTPVKLAFSNTNGNFNFNNLQTGNYKLHVEIAGVNSTPYPISLSASNPNISNILITVSNNSAIITGVEDELNNKLSVSEIYPNPSSNEAFIEIKNRKAAKVEVNIYDITGQKVMSEVYSVDGNKVINLNENNLANGIYTVKIDNLKSGSIIRKLIISK